MPFLLCIMLHVLFIQLPRSYSSSCSMFCSSSYIMNIMDSYSFWIWVGLVQEVSMSSEYPPLQQELRLQRRTLLPPLSRPSKPCGMGLPSNCCRTAAT